MLQSCWDWFGIILAFWESSLGYSYIDRLGNADVMLGSCWYHLHDAVVFSATPECTHTLLASHATKETEVFKSFPPDDAPQPYFYGNSTNR